MNLSQLSPSSPTNTESAYIGLLGGSFDPIHNAHVALAQAAARELKLTEVQLIPAANPWQRAPLHSAAEHRVRMIELAIAGTPALRVNTIEIDRGGATYTVDTIRSLPSNNRYIWILGTDQLANFCTWHDWKTIATRVDLAVAIRPGTSLSPPEALLDWLTEVNARPIVTLPFNPMDISASDIRARLKNGDDVSDVLAPSVANYITTHRLYQ